MKPEMGMEDLQGQDVGRYHITGHLGKGGMAVVYKAYDKRLERDVAIKFIHPPAIPPEYFDKFLKRFDREAKRMAQFTHPNIVPIFDYGEHTGIPYLVMPFLAGGSLKERIAFLKGKGVDFRDALRLLSPVARALEYAHARDTIHRDVKPSNILLNDKGQPMLADFGVAKVLDLDDEQTLTGTGMGIGTMKYMAPEQWKNHASVQTDIYALGAVLFELITGKSVGDIEIPKDGLREYFLELLPRSGKSDLLLREEMASILSKALAKEPRHRFRDMGSFAEAMELRAPTGLNDRTATNLIDSSLEASTLIFHAHDPSAGEEKSNNRSHYIWWITAGLASLVLLVMLVMLVTGTLQITIEGHGGKYIFNSLVRAPISSTISQPNTYTPQPSATPPAGKVRLSEKDGMEMVYVPGGDFTMGSTDQRNEKPEHSVFLDGFWMARSEVTNGMFARCVTEGGCIPPHQNSSYSRLVYYGSTQFENYPVVSVDWNQAQAYCSWVGGRLPTEAEWEKAGRGIGKRKYPWGEGIDCGIANFKGNDYGTLPCVGDTKAVGSFLNGSSPYGVLDMAGNVAEWVQDWYAEDYYATAPAANPIGPLSGEKRVVKGGAWGNTAWDVRLSVRDNSDPAWAGYSVGFRCVRSP